jgi:formate-dependent nitrite reductase membrane component NrfD
MYFVFFYLFLNLGDWTFKNFQKFLAFHWSPIDHFIVQFSPLIFIYPILKRKLNYIKEILLTTIIGIGTISLLLLIGIFIGIYTWKSVDSSPLIPDYLLVQPFENYWTIFIVIGLLIPILILRNKNKRKKTDVTIIDG